VFVREEKEHAHSLVRRGEAIIGRRLSHLIEDKHMLSDMQFGSRLGKRCISAVLKKVLQHDHIRLLKQTAAFVKNDATGCYDRLINNLILMVLKKLGILKTVADCLGTLWDSTIHMIKTIYGTSDITYTSTFDTPLYGPGQGSMCGPIFWILCYWLIVSSLDPTITAAKYVSVCRSIVIEITGVSFVDDTGLGVTSDLNTNSYNTFEVTQHAEIIHIVNKLKRLAQHWEKLLFTTGGAINLQKRFWYLIAWQWKNGQPKLVTIPQDPIHSQQAITIYRKSYPA
jgi:hypothetical protein